MSEIELFVGIGVWYNIFVSRYILNNEGIDDDWDLLSFTGQMNSNIIQLKNIFNKYFHLLKGIIKYLIINLFIFDF